ncbi:MAG: DUF262 domain-containing protein [Bacteroidota bacterium]
MEYRPIRIVDVIKGINRDYFLPDIQREFVWENSKIEKLFDSIMSDYPIGSFLFWKVLSENKNDWDIYEFIKNYDKEDPHNETAEARGDRDIFLVLDGQQRITSLFIGLLGTYRYFYYRWRKTSLYLNLLKEPLPDEENPEDPVYQFKFMETSPTNNEKEFWYKVGRILDFDESEKAKNDAKSELAYLPEELRTVANTNIGKLHNKIFTTTVINYYEEKTQDYDKVLNIFVRANSEGKPLEYSDLLLSTATAKWESLNAREEINKFTDEVNKIGNGFSFGKDFVLKGSLFLTEDLPIQYKVKNFTKPNLKKIETNWENICDYLRTTIRLISRFGFANKNLTAPIAILPIAYYLFKKSNKNFDKSSSMQDSIIQKDIIKWLIFALLKNAFGSSTDTKLKNTRDAINELTSFDSFPIKELNDKLGISTQFSDAEIEWLLSIKYQTRYSFLALSLLYPSRNCRDTIIHEDHIFPQTDFSKNKLKRRGYTEEKIDFYQNNFNNIINLQLLSDTENLSKNSTPFDNWILTRDNEFKETHKIPLLEDYSMDNFEKFIFERKEIIKKFFKAL